MTDTIPVAQLRAFVERIERIEADIKDLNSDKSEVYKELRGCGFDVKAVRAVVAKRKLDTADREERDAMFDLYWSALNGTGTEDATRVHVHGASYSEEKGRGVEVGVDTPHDAETGELTDNQESGAAGPCNTSLASQAADESEADDVGATASSTNPNSSDPLRSDKAETLPSSPEVSAANSETPASSSGLVVAAGEVNSSRASPAATRFEDGIPAFLRRTDGGYPKREEAY